MCSIHASTHAITNACNDFAHGRERIVTQLRCHVHLQAYLAKVTNSSGGSLRFFVSANKATGTISLEPARDHNVGVMPSGAGKRYCTSSIPPTLRTQLMAVDQGEHGLVVAIDACTAAWLIMCVIH